MTYEDELKQDAPVRLAEQEQQRIISRLWHHGPCSEGVLYVKTLRAATPQEVWDRCTRPEFMAWWLSEMAMQYEGLVEQHDLTSLGIALLRSDLTASPRYHEILDRIAVRNCPSIQETPFSIQDAVHKAYNYDLAIPYTEYILLRELTEVLEGVSKVIATFVLQLPDALAGSARKRARFAELIRLYFPTIPVPTLAQEEEAHGPFYEHEDGEEEEDEGE